MRRRNMGLFLILAILVLVAGAMVWRSSRFGEEPSPPEPIAALTPAESSPAPLAVADPEAAPTLSPSPADPTNNPSSHQPPQFSTNKLERLAQIRESFKALAGRDRASAMRAAKQLTDETERETALLTLVTEWTQGELSSPRQRARLIALYGPEAGLGFELVQQPELAVLWANELTEGRGRADLLQQTARALVESDPAAAFALSEQLPGEQRRRFAEALLANWAGTDTAAALRWAEQYADPTQREAALEAIRSVAPVGIGAALSVQDGYPVINNLVPGTPAELSGQLRVGDRVVAIAQGNDSFVDARNLGLSNIVQMIRGTPNTVVQLQVLPANAPPNSPPQIVPLVRGQISFKK